MTKEQHIEMLKKNKCYHISDASCEVIHWHGINHLIDYRKELETFYDALIETIMEDLSGFMEAAGLDEQTAY
jgi:hypothetical protein